MVTEARSRQPERLGEHLGEFTDNYGCGTDKIRLIQRLHLFPKVLFVLHI